LPCSWLPYSLGDGTLYVTTCPHMSYYLVGALSTLGFAALHTGSMVVVLDGMEKRDLKQGLLPSAAHLAAALLVGACAPKASDRPGQQAGRGGRLARVPGLPAQLVWLADRGCSAVDAG
jgi:hypothetical protein